MSVYGGKIYDARNCRKCWMLGKIQDSFEADLDRSERILRDFFTQAYSDIKDVFYERVCKEDEISYKLFVKNNIFLILFIHCWEYFAELQLYMMK